MGLMEIEMAKTLQQEHLAAADRRRRRRDRRRRADEQQDLLGGSNTSRKKPKVDWPVFSVRIGGFELVAFRTVQLGP